MKVLICGGRNYTNTNQFNRFMHNFVVENGPITCIVQGGARGADAMARFYANQRILTIFLQTYPADWETYGRPAGPLRNQEMLEKNPDIAYVIAFPGGKGTANMMEQARERGFKVIEIKEDDPQYETFMGNKT